MASYHAKRLTKETPFGDGYYIIKREGGTETLMPNFYCEDFPESEYEAVALARHLNERSRPNGAMFLRDNRSKRRVNE